ncbi:hypothetical protein SCHPADRAFT_934382 [Schizopora paradoxa]|uniref:DUF6533 domain-containing protein n=1 Tax=Schizopora paradoxa TaxID=27342 RepID=A0A0H2S8C3_9AGAM|nr:hypothetical protein SCHPADRAFT_934382 [Schizopora paradoxa]
MDSTIVGTLAYDFHALWIVKLCVVATTTFLVYEWISTIDEEVELIWKSKLTFGKVLYLLNRYMPFVSSSLCFYVWITDTNLNTCRTSVLLAASVDNVQFVLVNFSIYTRVNAVWGKNKIVFLILATTFTISVVCSSFVTSRYLSGVQSEDIRFLPHGCVIATTNNLVWINFINVMSWETLGLLLIMIKRYYDHTTLGSRLFYVILQDGILYFVAIQAVTIADIVLLNTLPDDLSSVCVPIQAALQSALCARLFIHLRSEAHKERVQREGTAVPSRNMDFAARSVDSFCTESEGC